MMASLLLSRVLGIVRDMIMAGKFARGPETDAYLLAFQIPDLLFFLIAGGALSSAFIPVFSEYLHTEREREAWKLFSVVVTFMSLLVGLFILIAWIYAEPLTLLVAPDARPEQIPLIVRMSRIVLPAQFAFFIGGILFGTLYARQHFAVPGLGPNVYNIGIILGAVLLSSWFTPGIVGMSWGALIGACVGNLLIPLWAMRRIGAHFTPSLDLRHPGVKRVFRLMLPVVLGLSLPGVYAMIMRAFGTFYDDGIVTSLDYSNKLMQAPLGVFGQGLALAVFPALSQFHSQGRMDRFQFQLQATLQTVLYLTVPVSVLMFALSPQIVVAVFEHGRFGVTDSEITAQCLRMFSLGIFAWCLHPVLMRGFFSMQRTTTPIVLGTVTTAVFLLLVFLLRQTPLEYLALPLASSISAVVLVLLLGAAIHQASGGLRRRELAAVFLKTVGCSAVVGIVAFAALQGMQGWTWAPRKVQALVELGVIGLGSAWMYYLLGRWAGLKEGAYVDRALARLSRRNATPQG